MRVRLWNSIFLFGDDVRFNPTHFLAIFANG